MGCSSSGEIGTRDRNGVACLGVVGKSVEALCALVIAPAHLFDSNLDGS